MTSRIPLPALRSGALLGEGPAWFDDALWFVDIIGRCIHRFDPITGADMCWPAPEQVGWVLPVDDGTILAALQSGLHRFDPEAGSFVLLAEVEPHLPGNRLNDACVDRSGHLWFGTMDDAHRAPTGAIYRYDNGVEPNCIPLCPITNGPAVSPDGTTLYAVDTLGRTIDAYDIDGSGHLGNGRRVAVIDAADGNPDGVSVDAAGNVWLGLYGGWQAHCYAPDGRLIERVRFPVANITKLAFGGPDLLTAYATTARNGLDSAKLAAQPHAGDVFAFPVTTPGLPTPRIAAATLRGEPERQRGAKSWPRLSSPSGAPS